MRNVRVLTIIVSIVAGIFAEKVMAIDMRKFGLEFPHNKQDEHGNTFWHQLACECKAFDDWSQVRQKEDLFKQNNKNWLPNPLIENTKGNTAKKEAKINFKQSGNPVCGLLVIYLRQSEEGFLNKNALRANRELMLVAQHTEHPNK